jgi:hypothetical protein
VVCECCIGGDSVVAVANNGSKLAVRLNPKYGFDEMRKPYGAAVGI